MDDSGKQTYSNALANGWTLEQVRNTLRIVRRLPTP